MAAYLTPDGVEIKPADFFLTEIRGTVGKDIEWAEWLAGAGRRSKWQHAGFYLGDGQIIIAETTGARITDVSEYDGRRIAWSTGKILIANDVRAQMVEFARTLEHTPYSYVDYLAIVAHHIHLWVPGLKGYIESSHSLICSQLVDYIYMKFGIHLFRDNRWPGDVMPSDLAGVIGA